MYSCYFLTLQSYDVICSAVETVHLPTHAFIFQFHASHCLIYTLKQTLFVNAGNFSSSLIYKMKPRVCEKLITLMKPFTSNQSSAATKCVFTLGLQTKPQMFLSSAP